MENAAFTIVEGIRTRYFAEGVGNPVVLVHGGSFASFWNAEDWEPAFDILKASHRVVAFDKVGCGFSDNPTHDSEYVIGATVRHAQSFLEAMNLRDVHLVGHSRGGFTAARLAIERPDLVRTLTIVDSSTFITPPNPLYEVWDERASAIDDLRERCRYLLSVNSWNASHITERYLDTIVEIHKLAKVMDAKTKLASGLEQAFKSDLVIRQAETHEALKAGRLTSPTLLMWGFEDPSATIDRCAVPAMELVMSSVHSAEMHIFNRAGHMPFREQPAAFSTALEAFLARHDANHAISTRPARAIEPVPQFTGSMR